MEHKHNNATCNDGTCGGTCGCGCGMTHRQALKWILRIALLAVVFCFAFQMGEVSGRVEAGMYYGKHQYRQQDAMMYNYHMMGVDTTPIQTQ